MTEILARGVQINSALYLACCFVAGMLRNNPFAWRLALVGIGLTYLSYSAQMIFDPMKPWVIGLTVATVAVGVLAGVALLF